MNEQLLAQLKRDIEEQYGQKYGAAFIDFDELAPADDGTVFVTFTIRKDKSFVTRYYGQATYQNQEWFLDVRGI